MINIEPELYFLMWEAITLLAVVCLTSFSFLLWRHKQRRNVLTKLASHIKSNDNNRLKSLTSVLKETNSQSEELLNITATEIMHSEMLFFQNLIHALGSGHNKALFLLNHHVEALSNTIIKLTPSTNRSHDSGTTQESPSNNTSDNLTPIEKVSETLQQSNAQLLAAFSASQDEIKRSLHSLAGQLNKGNVASAVLSENDEVNNTSHEAIDPEANENLTTNEAHTTKNQPIELNIEEIVDLAADEFSPETSNTERATDSNYTKPNSNDEDDTAAQTNNDVAIAEMPDDLLTEHEEQSTTSEFSVNESDTHENLDSDSPLEQAIDTNEVDPSGLDADNIEQTQVDNEDDPSAILESLLNPTIEEEQPAAVDATPPSADENDAEAAITSTSDSDDSLETNRLLNETGEENMLDEDPKLSSNDNDIGSIISQLQDAEPIIPDDIIEQHANASPKEQPKNTERDIATELDELLG